MEYWVSPTGAYALWYYPDTGGNWWAFGSSDVLGNFDGFIFAGSTTLEECPTHAGWVWQYHDGTAWVETNELSLECTD